ncbi:MAG: ABC transporter ATP-binding protein [Planctomycetes bacterium]|nr:ABC transporter ATP-binding protein [Planctomycetota bacterium]
MAEQPLLRIDNLAVSFSGPRGRVRAVGGVNLSIYPRQTLAVVGESGCGKSVTSLSILRLVPTPPGRFDSGCIYWSPDGVAAPADLLTLDEKAIRAVRGKDIAMIFQEPMTSLNPVYTIGEQIIEAVLLHQKVNRAGAVEVAVRALEDVGIADPRARLKEYPHQLSGGMRQRVMIAMALACNPKLLLADEPTTALDVTIQAQILELLRRLQNERGLSVLLITHDLGVVAENADVVAVMYAGRVVEYGSVLDVFHNPLHPYTKGLFASMPVLGRARTRLDTIPGNVPNPVDFPSGCPFHPRCAAMLGDTQCSGAEPPLLEVADKHWVACWHAPGFDKGKRMQPDLDFRRAESAVAGGTQ